MPVKLSHFGKGPVPVKKATACEAAAIGKRPGACEEGECLKLPHFGKGPVPVKKANACEAAAFWKRPGACEEGECL